MKWDMPSWSTLRTQRAIRAKVVTNSMLDIRPLWPQYRELVRDPHCQYQDTPALSPNRGRLHMDFTVLLFFAVNPGRGRELRTLRLLTEMPECRVQTLLRRLPEGDKVVIADKSTWPIHCAVWRRFWFPDTTPRKYRTRSRPRLLCR